MREPGDADGRGQDRRDHARLLPRDDQHDHHRDQREIEQQRRERRQAEAPLRAGQRQHHGRGAREGEIGQHQPRVIDREPQRVGPGKSRRQHAHDDGHQKSDQQGHDDERGADRAEHASGEGRRRGRAFGVAPSQPRRHQRRVQRALGEQAPDDVDELERRQKGVRDGTCAEQRREHGIARKSEQARGQRSRRHREEGADHRNSIEHDPEKRAPVFRTDHAQTKESRPACWR